MKNRKTVFEIVFSIIVICAVMAFVLRGEGFAVFIEDLKTLNVLTIVVCVALLLGYILSESVIIRMILSSLGEKTTFAQCCKYSFAGFFFHCITPAGSGEQPAQLIAMHRDGISTSKSVFTMTVITITFKLALVIPGAAVLILRPAEITEMIEPIRGWCILGMVLSSIVVALFICLLCIPSNVEKIAHGAVNGLCRLGILRNGEQYHARVDSFISKYAETVKSSRGNPKMLLTVQAVTILQRTFLLAITFMSAASLGLNAHGIGTSILGQGMVQLSTEMMPLPGGVGLNEWLFMRTFEPEFGVNTLSVLIISRGISFYGQLIICGIVYGLVTVIDNIRKKEGVE